MSRGQQPAVSVIEPISGAVAKVKTLLFKPFEINKWFTIGFCAWLAFLGQGGLNFQFNFPFGNLRHPGFPLGQVQDVFSKHFLLITVLGSMGLLIGLAVMITVVWLSSRGRFMFLYCISQNKAEVKTPWHKFRAHANNLFFFKLVAGFVVFVCLVLCAATIGLMIFLLNGNNGDTNIGEILAIVCLSFTTAVTVIAAALFFKFTNDFVIPIMYLGTCRCTKAWGRFLQILSRRKGTFALYILFQIVIAMFIGAIVMAVIFATCCCAAFFLVIPYIGTVLMLPLLVFKRAYSLYYLRQFGAGFDVFAAEVAAPQPEQGH